MYVLFFELAHTYTHSTHTCTFNKQQQQQHFLQMGFKNTKQKFGPHFCAFILLCCCRCCCCCAFQLNFIHLHTFPHQHFSSIFLFDSLSLSAPPPLTAYYHFCPLPTTSLCGNNIFFAHCFLLCFVPFSLVHSFSSFAYSLLSNCSRSQRERARSSLCSCLVCRRLCLSLSLTLSLTAMLCCLDFMKSLIV